MSAPLQSLADRGRRTFPSRFRLLILVAAGALLALSWRLSPGPQQTAVFSAPAAFGGPVNGGCYPQQVSLCKIHVDYWQPIQISPGKALLGVQLQANGMPIYDFRTDVSNPPTGSYRPSLVAKDFAVTCGESYTITLLAEESGGSGLVPVGSTNEFSCPVVVIPTNTPRSVFLPNVGK